MKKYFSTMALVFTLSVYGQTPTNDPHWQLLWQDNFDFFDSNRWTKADYCDHGGEPELYLAQNVSTTGGNLVIKIDNNAINCPTNPPVTSWVCGSCNSGIHQYTSGWVETSASSSVQFGYIEAKIKLPYGYGFWPAFWTWIGAPSHQEMDIFEMTGGTTEWCNTSHFTHDENIATSNFYEGNESACYRGVTYSIQDYTQWHTYGVEWSPSKVVYYVDDFPVRLIQNSQIKDPTNIILNLAIMPWNPPNSSTPFPSYMLIDYVKVYKLNEDCNDFINSTNYDFSNYNNIEKNFIRIGEGGGNNSISSGDIITLRASQYIYIDGNFYVPIGASLYMDANKDCSIDIGKSCTQTFNPCVFDFNNYDNSVKKIIELGGNGCNINITPSINSISLEATDKIILKPGVKITSAPGKSVNLKISSCQ